MKRKTDEIFPTWFLRRGVNGFATAIAAIGAATSLGTGIAGALSAGDSQDAANANFAKQGETLEAGQKIWDSYRAKGESLWGDYKKKYAPIEDKFLYTAKRGLKPDYTGITNMGRSRARQVTRQFNLNRGANDRDLARRGISSASPEAQALRLSSRLGEAAQVAGAYTEGNIDEAAARRGERRYAETTTFNRRQTAAGAGRGIQGAGLAAEAGTAQGYTGMADSYGRVGGNQADMAGQQAQAAGGAMSGLFQFGGRYLQPGSQSALQPGTQPAAPIIDKGSYSSAPGWG